jgi:hypothetical protein
MVSAVYYIKDSFPTDDIYVFQLYLSATKLISDWAPGSSLRTTWLERSKAAYTTLLVEQRNITEKYFWWIQGEGDAFGVTVPPYSTQSEGADEYYNNLTANLDSLLNEVDTAISPDYVVISELSINSSDLKHPYKSTVRTAQQDAVDDAPTVRFLIDTDDPLRYTFSDGDVDGLQGVHYDIDSIVNMGSDFFDIVNSI